MKVLISEAEVSWGQALVAVVKHSVTAPVNELAEYDAELLQQAANNVLSRLQEEREKKPFYD